MRTQDLENDALPRTVSRELKGVDVGELLRKRAKSLREGTGTGKLVREWNKREPRRHQKEDRGTEGR